MDEDINMQWVQGTLIPGFGNEKDDKVLFCFQQSQTFHETCRNQINTTVYFLPENHTDKSSPLIQDVVRWWKLRLVQQWKHGWKRRTCSLNKWHDRLSAKDRRILMTQWVGEAWSELSSDETFFKRLFKKTGCLLSQQMALMTKRSHPMVWKIIKFKWIW